jgi:hypothetical protein
MNVPRGFAASIHAKDVDRKLIQNVYDHLQHYIATSSGAIVNTVHLYATLQNEFVDMPYFSSIPEVRHMPDSRRFRP